uniref:Uncharacterized protein n=1 Tax=Sus scrofa TaxID=9823 RepID=A0A8D0Q9R7_PIG
MYKQRYGGSLHAKYCISLGLLAGVMINCAVPTPLKTVLHILCEVQQGTAEQTSAGVGDMMVATVRKGEPELREGNTSSTGNSTTEGILEKYAEFLYISHHRKVTVNNAVRIVPKPVPIRLF